MTKVCGKCKEEKPLAEFHKSKRHKQGVKNECANCTNSYLRRHYQINKELYNNKSREGHYLRRYGLTYFDYLSMCESVGSCCQICSKELQVAGPGIGKGCMDICVVDHCHSTGKIRGILCQTCNRGLGLFKDNSKVLQKASDYILSAQLEEE